MGQQRPKGLVGHFGGILGAVWGSSGTAEAQGVCEAPWGRRGTVWGIVGQYRSGGSVELSGVSWRNLGVL